MYDILAMVLIYLSPFSLRVFVLSVTLAFEKYIKKRNKTEIHVGTKIHSHLTEKEIMLKENFYRS